jgi:hypothetical protein
LDENVFDQIAGSDLEQRSEATLARRAEGRTMYMDVQVSRQAWMP